MDFQESGKKNEGLQSTETTSMCIYSFIYRGAVSLHNPKGFTCQITDNIITTKGSIKSKHHAPLLEAKMSKCYCLYIIPCDLIQRYDPQILGAKQKKYAKQFMNASTQAKCIWYITLIYSHFCPLCNYLAGMFRSTVVVFSNFQ